MTCPYFSNGEKECTDSFTDVVNIIALERCTSEEDFTDCIFYKMLMQPKKDQCKFMEVCNIVAANTILSLPYQEIKKQCETFCLSEDSKKNCVIYQFIEDLKRIPKGLLPDGSFIILQD